VRNPEFIIVFTIFQHFFLSCGRSIQGTPSHPISFNSPIYAYIIQVLSFLQVSLFLSSLPLHATCPEYLILPELITSVTSSGIPRNFVRGGGSRNLVEDGGQREWGSGGGSPLVRGSAGSCNLVQEISFHMVKFS